MTREPALSATTAEARHPVGAWWLLWFGLAWFGFWLLVMLPGQFMLVKLASVIDPVEKVAIGSFLIGEMSALILVSVPIIGWWCDRSSPRFGRRRTWALGGFVLATVPFAFVGEQTLWPVAALLLGVVAIGEAAVLVSLSAIIADQVPVRQRGRASAAMGVPQVIALAVGMLIVTELVTDVAASWFVIAMLALLSPLPFLLGFSEPAASVVARERVSFRFGWRRGALIGYRDYGWALVSRVLIHSGNLIGTTYLLYFLADVLGLEDPEGSLFILILFYLGASGLASWLGGLLSDRLHSRRVFVAVAAVLQAAAAVTLAVSPTWSSSIVAAILLGVGYGIFLAVDQALLTDVLPNRETRARDLGVVNSAQHLPIAPLIGWLVLGVAGYDVLYVVAALVMLLGGVAVFRIRSVR